MGKHNVYKKKRKNNQTLSVLICSLLFIAIIVFVVFFANNLNKTDKNNNSNSESQVVSSVDSGEEVTSEITSTNSTESISSIESSEPISSVESSKPVSSVESSKPAQSKPTSSATSSKPASSTTSSKKDTSSSASSNKTSSVKTEKPKKDTSSSKKNTNKLDPNFTNLLLVNGENPLPKNYNYSGNLKIIEDKYLCGWRNQLNKDVMPYATAMIEAAWADGVDLYILSPYRSYDTQVTLFENEVKKWMNKGMDRKSAENKASTVVARPGTSEHHTGMAIDFNSVEDSFERTPMYKWLDKNAHNYGFILRYTKDKQPITGVIHESWHWRFIGINAAKKYKASGNICLEEFVEKYGNEFK